MDFFDYEIPPDGILLMCSDGLSNMVEDWEIGQVLENYPDAEARTRTLIETANINGGKDNIAVVIVEPDAEDKEC